MFNKEVWVSGETLAVKFLKKQGYKIIQQNYKNKIGEIDIICFNKKENEIIFVEVKSRSSYEFGLPSEAVDFVKQQKIIKTAQVFLTKNNLLNARIRFDVIEIVNKEINHIKYAF